MTDGELTRDSTFGEEIHRYRVDSGLRVVVRVRRGFEKKFAVLATNFGSVDTRFVDRETGRDVSMPDGVAHFLEHKLFELEDGDALALFALRGASANAATSFRTTSFFFTCSDGFAANLRTLLAVVGNPWFSERSIEKERGIIAQEIRMYEDSPDWRGFIDLVRGLFLRHPVRADITGTVESISHIDRETLLTCYRNFYDPGNLCLVVSGDVDPAAVVRVAARATTGKGVGRAVTRLPIEEPSSVGEVRVVQHLPVRRPKLLLGFKEPDVPSSGADLVRRDQVTAVLLSLLFGSSSKTWLELYEEGVIDDSFHASYAGEEDFGFLTLGTETDDPELTREALFEAIRNFPEGKILGRDFGRVIHKMIGRFVRSLDSQESVAYLLLSSVFRGTDPFDVPFLLRRISPADVLERHRELFGEENHSTSIVLP